MPLFWCETKPVRFWEGMLENYHVAYVTDFSLSIPLAIACLKKGVKYFGVAMSSDHSVWAQNVINKEAVKVICDTAHVLHQESLAEPIKKHFEELVEKTDDNLSCDPLPATPP